MANTSPEVLEGPALKKPADGAPPVPRKVEPEPPAWPVDVPARPPRGAPGMLVLASVVLNALLAGGVVVLAMGFERRLDSLDGRAEASARELEAAGASLDALAKDAEGTRRAVEELGRAVASHAREEALFLKALILKPSLDQSLARTIAEVVHAQCELFGQDPNLVLAIMAVESDFNPRAVSSVGALGLMQVMPHWKKVLGLTADLTEPEVSIRAGIQILGFYQQMYGDVAMALTAYNRGPGPVDGALMRGASPANGYEAKVLATYKRLRGLDAKRP